MFRRIRTAVSILSLALACAPAAADCPPNTPGGLTASDGTSCVGVALDWNGVSAADYYEVWRNNTNNWDTAVLVGTPTATQYNDLTVIPDGRIYHYWITAYQIDILCGIGNHRSGHNNHTTGYAGGTPSAPTGVIASASTLCGSVYITWNSVSNASSYQVYRNTAGGSYANATPNGTSLDTDWTDVTAAVGQTYTYWVVATSLCGSSGPSTPDNGAAAGTPSAPTGVSASAGTVCGTVYITWNSVSGAASYDVYRANAGGTFAGASLVGASVTTNWTDLPPFVDQVYTYWVVSRNLCGTSGPSAADNGEADGPPEGPPTGVTASASTLCGSVYISWNPAARTASYDVYRANAGGTFAGASLVGASVTTNWTDVTAVVGQVYTYWVVSRNLCGTSDPSTPDNGQAAGTPSAPTGVSASAGTVCGTVYITWNSVSGAASYDVYRADAGGTFAGASLVGASVTTNWTDLPPFVDQVYTYWIVSRNLCGTSGPSTPDDGEADGPPDGPPTGVTASASTLCQSVYITWNPAARAAGYDVYRANAGGTFAGASFVGATVTTNWTDVTAGYLAYSYWIVSRNLCGTSGPSAPADGQALGDPDAPTGVSVSRGTDCSEVDLSWNAVAGAAAYTILRSSAGNPIDAIPVGVTIETTWSDHTAIRGRAYTYWIAATNVCGNSNNSTSASLESCPADFNCDGALTSIDILDCMNDLSVPCPSPCPIDFNGDGVLNVADLQQFLADWLVGCN